jgi:hypothetical protein
MGVAGSKNKHNISKFDWSNPQPYLEYMIKLREDQYNRIDRLTKKDMTAVIEEDVYILKQLKPMLRSRNNTRSRTNNRPKQNNTRSRPNKSQNRRGDKFNKRLNEAKSLGLSSEFIELLETSSEEISKLSDEEFDSILQKQIMEEEEEEEEAI